jgi:hypothetical protein
LRTNNGIMVSEDPRLHGAIGIYFVSKQRTVVYTLHHPIGVTDLDKDKDWVFSRGGEVQDMLLRAEDPGEAALEALRAKFITELQVAAGFLVRPDEKSPLFYPEDLGEFSKRPRREILEEAEKVFKGNRKAAEEEWKTHYPTAEQQKANKFVFAHDKSEYLPELVRIHEKNLKRYAECREVRTLVEEAYPQLYRTGKGPFGTDPQVGLDFTGDGDVQFMDAFLKNFEDNVRSHHKATEVKKVLTVEERKILLDPVKAKARWAVALDAGTRFYRKVGTAVASLRGKSGEKGAKSASASKD